MTTPAKTPTPIARRKRVAASIAIFAIALGVRWLHAWQLESEPLFDFLMGDARSYDIWAREISGGDWLGNAVFYQAPLYPYFLAVVYGALGDGLWIVRAVQGLLGAASCVMLAAAGWRLFSWPAGIAAGLLLAFYGPAIFADATVQKASVGLALLSAALWILAGVVDDVRPRRCLALGAVLGALALTRENALIFALVIAPWLVVHRSQARSRWVAPLLFAAGLAGVLLPVALRNAYVGGEFHLTTSQLGPNLYIGNNPSSVGTYLPLRQGRGDPRYESRDAKEIAERASGRALTAAEVSSFYLDRTWRYVRSQPLDWIGLVGRKFLLAANAVESVDTDDPYTQADASIPLRASLAVLHFGVLAPLGAFGVWLTWGDRRRLRVFHLLFLAYTATLLAFYVLGRYRLPLVPFLVVFAGAGLAGAVPFARSAGAAQLGRAVAVVVAIGVLANWPLLDRDYMRSVTRYNLGNQLYTAGRRDDAIAQFRQAIRLFSDNAQAHHNLGSLRASAGEFDVAATHFERAIAIRPSYAEAYINLGRVRRDQGDRRAAIPQFEHGLREEPSADGFAELAMLYLDVGEPALALRCFEAALGLDPGHDAALRGRSLARAAAGGAGEALPGRPSVCQAGATDGPARGVAR